MDPHFQRRGGDDPWEGRQPRYEKLLYRGPGRFFAQTRLPSERRVAVRLASVSAESIRGEFRPLR